MPKKSPRGTMFNVILTEEAGNLFSNGSIMSLYLRKAIGVWWLDCYSVDPDGAYLHVLARPQPDPHINVETADLLIHHHHILFVASAHENKSLGFEKILLNADNNSKGHH
jgi:hypothetical protein